MKKMFWIKIYLFLLHKFVYVFPLITNHTKSPILTNEIDSDYYYEYELSNNITNKFNHDSEILPNPESLESQFTVDTVDVLPEVEIPDNSLADTDLHDHDFIDNIMYIYYGTHSKNGYTFGAEIILIGSVLSCAAQFLTIICTLLRKNIKNYVYKLHFNIIFALCVTNLIFMLGIYATKYRERCKFIAVLLHYMHLLVSVWIFTHSYIVLKKFSNEYVPKVKIVMLLSYGIPAFVVLLCYGITPNSYESKKFCWMSVEKGMLLNFMIPIMPLIVLTTWISINGIRKINLELSKYELSSTDSIVTNLDFENKSKIIERSVANYFNVQLNQEIATNDTEDNYLNCLHACKACLKVLSIVQTTYVVVWFIAVLALENAADSLVMPLIYATCSIILNWYIFVTSKYLSPNIKDFCTTISSQNDLNSIIEVSKTIEEATTGGGLSHCDMADNVPLLNSSENYTAELIELRTESISTISS